MDKRDLYIKAKLQEDKKISNQANEIFEKFEGEIKLKNNNEQKERKVLKLSLNQAILAFTSLMIVFVLGGNLYAHLNGKPNLYSAIKNLFIKEAKYTESEIVVDKTVENNGIKLILKTVAMDENVLITKYIAEGEKLANEFYTYPEFEEDMVDLAKKYYASKNVNIGEDKYKNVKSSDVTAAYNNVKSKLISVGISANDATDILETGDPAYKQYIGAQLGVEGTTTENAKKLIAETIAMFESKVSSKYEIMESVDTLQDFNIEVVSQKIEKSGNQYIIYNVYNVDTISDLASKFNLDIKIEQIGSTKGTWKFSTKLEKARLDTRVETIDFYENNSSDNVASLTTAEGVKHSATVEAKRLVISDFSTVLMMQTRVSKEDSMYYFGGYGENGLPCIFVVTDENNNVLGTGTCPEKLYSMPAGNSVIYTDRIILENVNKDTKKLYVKIHEQWSMTGNGENELVKNDEKVIELDIETARTSNKPVELTQSYSSKNVQVSFKYPGEWTVTEENNQILIEGPKDIDGNCVSIIMTPDTEDIAHPGMNSKDSIEGLYNTYTGLGEECQKGEVTIAEKTGYYFAHEFGGAYEGKSKNIKVDREENQFTILYTGILTQYARYEETFNKILETIEFIESEKSYVAYYSNSNTDSLETVKVYEDNTATIQISQHARDIFGKNDMSGTVYGSAGTAVIDANVEYTIEGIDFKIKNVDFIAVSYYETYNGSWVFVYGENDELYLLDMNKAIKTGKFEAVEIKISGIRDNPRVEDWPIGDKQTLLVIVTDANHCDYIISRDGKLEQYIKPVYPDEEEYIPENPDEENEGVLKFPGGEYYYEDEAGNIYSIRFYSENNEFKFAISNSNGDESILWPIEGTFTYDSLMSVFHCSISRIGYTEGQEPAQVFVGFAFHAQNDNKILLLDDVEDVKVPKYEVTENGLLNTDSEVIIKLFPEGTNINYIKK